MVATKEASSSDSLKYPSLRYRMSSDLSSTPFFLSLLRHALWCITGGPPQHATVPAVATPPLHCRLRHWCVHPRSVSARPSCRPGVRGDPLGHQCGGEDASHRTQLPSRENILLPFTPNTSGAITSGGRASTVGVVWVLWSWRTRRRSHRRALRSGGAPRCIAVRRDENMGRLGSEMRITVVTRVESTHGIE